MKSHNVASSLVAALVLSGCGPIANVEEVPESAENLAIESSDLSEAASFGLSRAAVPLNHQKVLPSVVENADFTEVALPIRLGEARGRYFWYVLTEASNQAVAKRLGLNFSPKLANARGTAAVQKARVVNGVLWVNAGVNFAPQRSVVPGPNAFPPASFAPGSVGEAGYSPLIELPDGTVLNAPQISNATGTSDKVIRLDTRRRVAVLGLAEGFYEDQEVYYVSLDSSGDLPASLEAVNFAPNLNSAPGLGSNALSSARAGIALFVNGQTGANNPNRQGLRSALLGEGGPNNVIQTFPLDEKGIPEADYSPLWDAHVSEWPAATVAGGLNVVQEDFDRVAAMGAAGTLTAPGGAWGAANFIVNCPVVSIDRAAK
jgi:hypothetical protein